MTDEKHGIFGEFKYCTVCGEEMEKVGLCKYDKNTGKSIYYIECPSGMCEHDGIEHDYIRHNEKYILLKMFFKIPEYTLICSKCGNVKKEQYDWFSGDM